jgi:hypothetical protein
MGIECPKEFPMSRQGSVALASAMAIAAGLVCAAPRPALADPGDPASGALIVLPGARDVHRSSRDGALGVRYRMTAEFPAAGPIVDVVKRLQRRGWIPLIAEPRSGWMASSLVRGWTSFVDASGAKPIRTYSWWSEWTNLGGDHVSFAFRYDTPEHGASAMRSLSVAAGFYPAPLARQLKEEATRSAELFAQTHPAQPAAERTEARTRTVLSARAGDAFLVSGPAGEAVLQVTGRPGGQVAYRWRFRGADGATRSGSVPGSSTLSAGPFLLEWQPRHSVETSADLAGVGYLAESMSVMPVPSQQFDTLDLGAAHALATLLPRRNGR